MKITTKQLKQIIKEELYETMDEGSGDEERKLAGMVLAGGHTEDVAFFWEMGMGTDIGKLAFSILKQLDETYAQSGIREKYKDLYDNWDSDADPHPSYHEHLLDKERIPFEKKLEAPVVEFYEWLKGYDRELSGRFAEKIYNKRHIYWVDYFKRLMDPNDYDYDEDEGLYNHRKG